MAYYLGIDGGGSKTTCVVGDEVSILATATAGPSNITRVGEVRAREALLQAARETCGGAKIDPRVVSRACIGVAGAGREEIAGAVRKIIAEVISGEIKVVGDMEIALEAAFGVGPGVIVVAGTGSIAYGRDAAGRSARAGGWGFAISDEGSAHWIGRAAVSGVLRAIDEEKAQTSSLFGELKAAWKLHSLDEFVRKANSNPDFAALLPSILAAADAGNALAQRVLAQAGGELAQIAGIVVRRLFGKGRAVARVVPMAIAGGVFRHSARVLDAFCDEVRRVDTRVEVNPRVVEPVAGALQMARLPGR